MPCKCKCNCEAQDLEYLGLKNLSKVHWNYPVAKLYEQAIINNEAHLVKGGALVVDTGKFTGRSPNDKFVVKDAETENTVDWSANKPISPEQFDKIYEKMQEYLTGKEVYLLDTYVGADPAHQLNVRVITEFAWQAIFAGNMFNRIEDEEVLAKFAADFTIVAAPKMHTIGKEYGINSDTFILLNFTKKMILIGGTEYGGEIKKSVFTVMNYLLPKKGVMGMHCSANLGTKGDSALLFGLSGTGKTTLSADPHRALIGDDEHGWSDNGIFNFEGGCYAKVINLSAEQEPEIHRTTHTFGTILENVVFNSETREIDLFDNSKTENTRSSYPLSQIDNVVPDKRGGHPKNIIFLTADAFGVLPPISRLTPEQAMYHFLLGYTAKVAGTERGITEPQATFSTCFGAPFMPMHPSVYAKLLGEKMTKHDVKCWLLNTGWIEGPYGEGHRISLKHTRALLNAALDGSLNDVKFETEQYFGLSIPTEYKEVPTEILNPKNSWKDANAYDAKARDLAARFKNAFKQYEEYVTDEVKKAAPLV